MAYTCSVQNGEMKLAIQILEVKLSKIVFHNLGDDFAGGKIVIGEDA